MKTIYSLLFVVVMLLSTCERADGDSVYFVYGNTAVHLGDADTQDYIGYELDSDDGGASGNLTDADGAVVGYFSTTASGQVAYLWDTVGGIASLGSSPQVILVFVPGTPIPIQMLLAF